MTIYKKAVESMYISYENTCKSKSGTDWIVIGVMKTLVTHKFGTIG